MVIEKKEEDQVVIDVVIELEKEKEIKVIGKDMVVDIKQ